MTIADSEPLQNPQVEAGLALLRSLRPSITKAVALRPLHGGLTGASVTVCGITDPDPSPGRIDGQYVL